MSGSKAVIEQFKGLAAWAFDPSNAEADKYATCRA